MRLHLMNPPHSLKGIQLQKKLETFSDYKPPRSRRRPTGISGIIDDERYLVQ